MLASTKMTSIARSSPDMASSRVCCCGSDKQPSFFTARGLPSSTAAGHCSAGVVAPTAPFTLREHARLVAKYVRPGFRGPDQHRKPRSREFNAPRPA